MQKLAVVYFPKIHLETIGTFRRKYDPYWDIISPHITIVSPLSDISENQLVDHLDKVIRELSSFSIRLHGLTKTSDDCLFLLVSKGNEEIVHLHDKLYSGILTPYLPTDFPFVPHITLGYSNVNDDKAYAEAEDLHFDITCDFDTLSLIKGDGFSPAVMVKSVSL